MKKVEVFYITPEEAEQEGLELMTEEEAAALLGDGWDEAPDVPEDEEEGGDTDGSQTTSRTPGTGR